MPTSVTKILLLAAAIVANTSTYAQGSSESAATPAAAEVAQPTKNPPGKLLLFLLVSLAIGALAGASVAVARHNRSLEGIRRALTDVAEGSHENIPSSGLSGAPLEIVHHVNRIVSTVRHLETELAWSSQCTKRANDLRRIALAVNKTLASAKDHGEVLSAACKGWSMLEGALMAVTTSAQQSSHPMSPIAWWSSASEASLSALHHPADSATIGYLDQIRSRLQRGNTWVNNEFASSTVATKWKSMVPGSPISAHAAVGIHRGGQLTEILHVFLGGQAIFDTDTERTLKATAESASFVMSSLHIDALRRAAVEEANAGYNRFRKIFDALPNPALMVAVGERTFLDANESFAREIGTAPERVVGSPAHSGASGIDRETLDALIEAASTTGHIKGRALTVINDGARTDWSVSMADLTEFAGQNAIMLVLGSRREAEEVEPAPTKTRESANEASDLDGIDADVLLVDDDEITTELVRALFERWPDVRLHVASTGAKAMEVISSVPIDLLMLDMHLPDTTGEEILRSFRQIPGQQAAKVALFSGDVDQGVRARLQEAGVVEFWDKPPSLDTIAQRVVQLLRTEGDA